jgi:hypothetical protein
MLAAALQLRKTMEAHPLKHCISFHNSIARAVAFQLTQQNITKKFSEYGQLETFHVSGAMPTSARQRKLDEAVASKRSLITNARCLTEGVDVKEIDGVLFADPKGSTVDIVQAVGRALRPSKGKKRGYVVVPVVLDAKNLEKRIEQNEAYQDILMVLRALASNDERIVEYFRSVSQGKRPKGGNKKFIFTVPAGLDIDPEEFAKQVELQVWGKLAKLSWRPFEEAREFVQNLGLVNFKSWISYCLGENKKLEKKPEDIPTNPNVIYSQKGWGSWGDWLGSGVVAARKKQFRGFVEAREFVRGLKIKSSTDYRKYCNGELAIYSAKPSDIPSNPNATYKDEGWNGYGDWLETGNLLKTQCLPFEEAREYVCSLNLTGQKEWHAFAKGLITDKPKRPTNIPTNPHRAYKDEGWNGYGDWLGTGNIHNKDREFRSFSKARTFVRKLKLRSETEWRKYRNGQLDGFSPRPDDIPSNPNRTYQNEGWKGMPDFIGYAKKK